jgi:hypothetical protein
MGRTCRKNVGKLYSYTSLAEKSHGEDFGDRQMEI